MMHETACSDGAGSLQMPASTTSQWAAVFCLALLTFVLIASEFMPVSLLTPMATDLRVSEGRAGYGIAISGPCAALASLSMPTLAGSMNRKPLLPRWTAL